MRIVPLFVVTGASGVGKTRTIMELRRLLPEWEIFETDILWDSARDLHCRENNWLRIAHSITQSGRATLLSGTHLPQNIDRCDARDFFSNVYYVNLHCDDATRAARLRARPPWRGADREAFIADQQRFAQWLLEHGRTTCNPPMTVIDTTAVSAAAVATRIRDWARRLWARG